MPASNTPRRVGLSFSLDTKPFGSAPERTADPVLRVLIAADCSGRRNRGQTSSIEGRALRRVDVDRFAGTCRAWGALISSSLSKGGTPVSLSPRDLDDLHPDQLLRSVPVLAEVVRLRDLSARDPSAAVRLKALLEEQAPATPVEVPGPSGAVPAPAGGVLGESSQDTLSRLLGGTSAIPASAARATSSPAGVDVQRLIRNLVGASAVAAASPDLDALASNANLFLQNALVSILHDPAFRALEATWRGIDGLIRNCPDEELVEYSVLDASLQELSTDPGVLARVLSDGGFSVLLVDHQFRPTREDLERLVELLKLCNSQQVTLVTGAHAELAGSAEFAHDRDAETGELLLSEAAHAAWAEVVRLREAGARLSLALPRFLLRQPYGSSGEPLEQLAFEEIADVERHDAFPWGNGAYLLTRALSQVHASEADPRYPDGSLDIRELPVVHLEGADGIRLKPCAEIWLSDRALGRLLAAGFSVLQGLRDSDRIRVHL